MLRYLSTNSMGCAQLFLVVQLILVSCNSGQRDWESFGAPVQMAEVPGTSEMLTAISGTDSADVKFSGTVEEVCQMKGCWMTLKSDAGERIRVTFKDYGFFMPKDAAGREVIIDGIASVVQLDEPTAHHFADDSGRPFDPQTDLKEVSIVASGVLMSKAP